MTRRYVVKYLDAPDDVFIKYFKVDAESERDARRQCEEERAPYAIIAVVAL